MRLDKFLKDTGAGSRSEVKALIKKGLVTVNGSIAKSAELSVSEADAVCLSGQRLSYRKFVYIMMNKPSGVVCATHDGKYKTVTDITDGEFHHRSLFPVGRLDIDTEGLLLLTDDGDFAHRVTSPSKNVDKTYYLKTLRPLEESYGAQFAEGVYIPGGHKTKPASFKPLGASEALLTVSEGRFHQVKYMLNAVGNEVVYLKRIKIGALSLDDTLAPGEYRQLLPTETVF